MLNKEKNFVSVVAYLHNNEKEVVPFLDYIVEQLEQNFEKCELIFVNDASKDNGASVVREYLEARKCSFMTNIITMSSYHGIEASMLAGVDLAIGDFVYEFDSLVLDYPKEMFMDVYYASLKGDDIVAAAPEGKADTSSELFYGLYNRFRNSGKGEQLRRETFRIVSRRAINRVQTLGKFVPYRKVMYQNSGLGYKHILYKKAFSENRHLTRKEQRNREDLAFDTLLMFTNLVQRVSMAISILFFVFAIAVGVYVVIVYFSPNKPVEGWAPMMGFLAAGFSGIFVLFTVLLKYMSVILEVTFSRKRYLISGIEKINS